MRFLCQALLFDLDGVLVDSNRIVERHWIRWANLHGLDPAPILASHHGRPTVETIRQFAPHLDADAEARAKEPVEADDVDGLVAYDGAARLLSSLPADRFAIVTSGTRRTAAFRLRHLGLPTPEVFVTADDIRRGKPAPDPYLLAAERLKLDASKCVVIEDAPAGIASGQAAGARVIAVVSTNPPAALSQADAIAERLADIHAALWGEQVEVLLRPAEDGEELKARRSGETIRS